MPRLPHPSVRNESLRLSLSQHEKDYIEEGLQKSARVVKSWLILLVVCLVLASVPWVVRDLSLSFYYNIPKGLWQFCAFATPVIGFIAMLKLFLAVFDYQKFRSYRSDHAKFLKSYRRGA